MFLFILHRRQGFLNCRIILVRSINLSLNLQFLKTVTLLNGPRLYPFSLHKMDSYPLRSIHHRFHPVVCQSPEKFVSRGSVLLKSYDSPLPSGSLYYGELTSKLLYLLRVGSLSTVFITVQEVPFSRNGINTDVGVTDRVTE